MQDMIPMIIRGWFAGVSEQAQMVLNIVYNSRNQKSLSVNPYITQIVAIRRKRILGLKPPVLAG